MVVGAPAAADAATVGGKANNSSVSLIRGQTLTIKLRPADSGSTGFHWRVAKRPARSVLRLKSDRTTSGGQQVFIYRARGAGGTILKLQYVGPARHARALKTFRLTAIVNTPEPKYDCNASGASESSTVARSGLARVFKVRRTAFIEQGDRPARVGYDAYYGCELSQDRAVRLGNIVDLVNPHRFWNVTLRGAVVGFVHQQGCPFNGNGCETIPPEVASQDLHTGRVIRAVVVGSCGPGCDNPVTGLVLSATGGLAWIEHTGLASPASNVVRRSDLPAQPGQAFATDVVVLDNGDQGLVDPDSLEPDSTEVTWLRAGTLQRAPLG
jgi:predicted secreted protein